MAEIFCVVVVSSIELLSLTASVEFELTTSKVMLIF